jgi:pantothenate synthetase
MAYKKYKVPYKFEVRGVLEIEAVDGDSALSSRNLIIMESKRALARNILKNVTKGSVKIKNK